MRWRHMKRVKFLASLLVLALVLQSGTAVCRAASVAVVTGQTVTAAPGQIVEYRVFLDANPGIAAFLLRLRFDTSALVPVCENENDPGAVRCDRGDFSAAGNLIGALTEDGCQVIWTNNADVRSCGALFVLRLQVSERAQGGTYPIQIEYSAKNTLNASGQRVPLSCTGGSVTVRETSPAIYGEKVMARRGETLEYAVCVRDNPGLSACNLQVSFDQKALSLTGVKKAQGAFASGSLESQLFANGAKVIWYTGADTRADGELFILSFRVLDTAALGPVPVAISFVEESGCVDENGNSVALACENGEILIRSGPEVTIRFDASGAATVSLKGAGDNLIAAALYDRRGQLCAISLRQSPPDGTVTLRAPRTMSGGSCQVMVLDRNYRPVCPVIREENT